MRRWQLRSFFVLFLLALSLFGAGTPTTAAAAPTSSAPRPIRPEGLAAFVDQFVQQKMEAAHAPGLVVTVVYQGEVLLARGYGLADLETGRPMTAQTPLRAGSLSKPVTSAAVLQLAAAGRVALDTPVSAYLPRLPLADHFGPAATVAQLLTLQGGYADTVVETHAPALEQWQPLDAYLADHLPPRVMPPGKVHSYNSWDHALLGQMMAEVQALPFDETMEQLLFRPLGMTRSTFTQPLPAPIASALAQGYAFQDGRYQEVPLDYVRLSPGVALVTSGEDMGRFMLALMNGGLLDGAQRLAPSTVDGMLRRQQPVHPASRGRTYGFSELELEGRPVLYQDGNGIGQGSRMILAPDAGLGIFLSSNHRPLGPDAGSTPAYDFVRELGSALVRQYLPPVGPSATRLQPLPGTAERAPRYAGHYRLAGTPQGDFFKLNALLDNVDVRAAGDGALTIGANRYVEVEPRLFQRQSDPASFVVFVEDDAGEVQWLTFGGTNSYQKVSWYETPRFQLALVGAILLISLSFLLATPFARQRHWRLWLLSLLQLGFFAGLALLMTQSDLILFFKTVPLPAQLLFLLPWLGGALTLSLPLALLALQRSGAPRWQRLHYALLGLAAAAFLWFASYWNLVL